MCTKHMDRARGHSGVLGAKADGRGPYRVFEGPNEEKTFPHSIIEFAEK